MKYNIGDLFIDTCYMYQKDWKTGIIINIKNNIIQIKWSHLDLLSEHDIGTISYNVYNKIYKHLTVK